MSHTKSLTLISSASKIVFSIWLAMPLLYTGLSSAAKAQDRPNLSEIIQRFLVVFPVRIQIDAECYDAKNNEAAEIKEFADEILPVEHALRRYPAEDECYQEDQEA